MVSEPSSTLTAVRFRVLVLGPFALERDGAPLDTSRWQRRVTILFKLLATAPGRQRLRDDLIDILWPESGPDTGANNLRILVHRLRLTLGGDPSPVLSEHGWIALNPAYTWELDLDQLETLVGNARGDVTALEQAAELYRGEPLAEDRYEDWATPIRERAQRLWRQLCMHLASLYRSRGSYGDAANWFERVLESDPLDEEAVRGLLTVLSNGGRPADALRRYNLFEQRLAEELDVPPSADTLTLIAGIKAQLDDASSAARLSDGGVVRERPLPVGRFLGAIPDVPLIDREEELERILFAVDAVESGAGRVVFCTGEPGVGKTRLAQETMIRLRARSWLVATGRCYERHRVVPYDPFLDLLPQAYAAAPPSIRFQASQRWPRLELLLPDQMDAPPDIETGNADEQQIMFRSVTGFLRAMAEEQPLALLLDDLHWADEGSLDLLLHLARQTRNHRVLLLSTYRDGDISREHPLGKVVRGLAREGLLERIPVPRLSPEGTAALVATSFGETVPPDELAEFVHRRTKGNPFFVQKMVQALGGRYRLVRQVGAGGMGRVFEAIDTRTGERVAAKLMFARTEADSRALLRFQQEGAVLASLEHPNIVNVHGTFVEEHASCIIMELIEGRSLGQLLHSEELSLPRIKELMQQVTRALTFAHERGIAHRDIKPDNIMVDNQDHVTVTDFGIARLLRPHGGGTTMTSTGMTMGTPLYMAPEQIEGRRVDGRADLYSLGAVLYQLVTGRPPFEGEDPLSVAFKHVHQAPVPPRAINPRLPEDWEALILKALAKDPASRFQSAVAMERAIGALSVEETNVALILPIPSDSVQPQLSLSFEGASRTPARSTASLADECEEQPRRRRPGTGRRRALRRTVLGGIPAIVAAIVGAFLLVGHAAAPSRPAAHGTASTWNDTSAGSGRGQLDGPAGITVDAKGDLYVTDQGNSRVQEFSPAGRFLQQWGTKGKGALQFDTPGDIVIGPDGDVYVADHGNKRIMWLRGGHEMDEAGYDTSGLGVDRYGNLYAPDYYYHYLRLLSPEVRSLKGWSVPEIEVGRFPYPAGLDVDAQGRIYVADREHDRIDILSPSAKLLTHFGNFGRRNGQFDKPTDVALDSRGNIYVADAKNDRVQKFSPQGLFLGSWGSSGTGPGQFDRPCSIAVDSRGNIYVSDHFNNRVQKLSPAGKPIWATHGLEPIHV